MKIVSVLIITRLTLSKAADDPCEPCRGAAICFQEGCAAFDIDKQTWSGLFSDCNGDGNGGAALCYDACYPGACKSLPMCTACSDNDLTAVGVSEECFTAVGEYEDSLSEEPKYANDCDSYAVASNVTVECQEAVADYHDCGGNYNFGPVCTACDNEDPDVDGVSENCYNALVSFRPSGKPVYEETCEDSNDASDVTVECIRALGEYFGPLCESDKSDDHDSVCDACEDEDPDVVGASEKCFTAVGEYEDGLDEEPPYAQDCEDIDDASDVTVECKAAVIKHFKCPSSDDTAICKDCASEDISTEGVSNDCYVAVWNYKPPGADYPPYASKCGEPKSASVVTTVCQAAVYETFDCLGKETKTKSPTSATKTKSPTSATNTKSPTTSQSSAITVSGAAVTLITMTAMMA